MSEAVKEKKLPGFRKYKPYPAYKDSGVEWLGEVPAHWEIERLKRFFKVLNGSTPSSANPNYWDGDLSWVTPDDLGELKTPYISLTKRNITVAGYNSCGTNMAPIGSIVVSTRAPIGHLAIANVDLCTNQGCRSLVPIKNVNSKYYYYLLYSAKQELNSFGQGSTFKELSKTELENLTILYPTNNEQNSISFFLDRETAKIDALIAKQERLIELLQEKRTALITRAVTRGLDPDVPMKDSGVEWLGEIPEHWGVIKLKHIVFGSCVNGIFKTKEYYGTGVRLVNVIDIYRRDFFIDTGSLERVEVEEEEEKRYSVKDGDIFFVRSSLKLEGVGRSACALSVKDSTVFECHLVRIRPNKKIVFPHYLIHFLNAHGTMQRLISLANVVTMATIDQDKIKSLEVPLPPLKEQNDIINYFNKELEVLDKLENKVVESIVRLREYRVALISAAVTGKIDVREEVP